VSAPLHQQTDHETVRIIVVDNQNAQGLR
ncbi:MAG: hypothetical protein RLZZ413_2861, partial [Pseudomonadota bacterium]